MIKNFFYKNKLPLKNIAKNIALGLGFGLSALILSVLISYSLYQPKKMVKRGFEVEIKTASDTKVENIDGVKTGNLASVKGSAKVETLDIATMITNADIDAGAKIFKKCATCHTIEKGGASKVGPNLYAIVGKKRASMLGFNYSEALKAKSGSWSVEDLNIWLTKPKDFVPGTKMGFAGLKKDKDRANVIAYLKQQGK